MSNSVTALANTTAGQRTVETISQQLSEERGWCEVGVHQTWYSINISPLGIKRGHTNKPQPWMFDRDTLKRDRASVFRPLSFSMLPMMVSNAKGCQRDDVFLVRRVASPGGSDSRCKYCDAGANGSSSLVRLTILSAASLCICRNDASQRTAALWMLAITRVVCSRLLACVGSTCGFARHVIIRRIGSDLAQPDLLTGSRSATPPRESTVSPCSVRCTGACSHPKK